MKLCRGCNEEREDEKFELVTSPIKYGGNGKQYRRNICSRCRSKKINSTRQDYRREYNIKNKDKRVARKRELTNIAYHTINGIKLSNPCGDCGNYFCYEVMDFDHIRDKNTTIARMMSSAYKIETIILEIEKCDLVCANCHRIRTYARQSRVHVIPTHLYLIIDSLKFSAPCDGCNLYFPSVCMQFDHIDPSTKLFGISDLRCYSINNLNELLAEVQKCQLLCTNCHRIKTREDEWQQQIKETQ
jgi:hypothetical protein